ncbi:hypothetical protein AVEN_92476-1 [Araneus ventricosus]|uniref:Uncharacterized protein n=1 Tax=Araneus ventricosus TaxID=182803 RepID=A0A4Y2AJ92_ARAVE|nr:hypothetical protein AVEN_92476-1 [Araneus ventricosus]
MHLCSTKSPTGRSRFTNVTKSCYSQSAKEARNEKDNINYITLDKCKYNSKISIRGKGERPSRTGEHCSPPSLTTNNSNPMECQLSKERFRHKGGKFKQTEKHDNGASREWVSFKGTQKCGKLLIAFDALCRKSVSSLEANKKAKMAPGFGADGLQVRNPIPAKSDVVGQMSSRWYDSEARRGDGNSRAVPDFLPRPQITRSSPNSPPVALKRATNITGTEATTFVTRSIYNFWLCLFFVLKLTHNLFAFVAEE